MNRKYNEFSDDELLSLLSNDNQSAFVSIYDRYWKKLFVVGGNFLKNPQDIEECIQNIFIDLWSRRAELNIEKGLEYYLAVSVKYQSLNILLKKRKHHDIVNLIQNDIDYNTPEVNFLTKELEQRIAQSINKLPTQCKLVFKLKYDEGLSVLQIAEFMSISKNTVKMHLKIANKRIRKDLLIILPYLLTLFFKK